VKENDLIWLKPGDPDASFPSLDRALKHPNGLLAVGGDLTPGRLLLAYSSGIFPWYEQGQPIFWWSPDPRAVLLPERIVVARSLKRSLRTKMAEATFDHAFEQVVTECAAPAPGRERTWITPEMKAAYGQLHEQGWGHSVEVWDTAKNLTGGLYGIAIGSAFFGESMFSRGTDGSKMALAILARHLAAWGYAFIDCQVPSAHLNRMGAQDIKRKLFSRILAQACSATPRDTGWKISSEIIGSLRSRQTR
jgi:leucyl/phenylalanyl-tRNA---protein transferase